VVWPGDEVPAGDSGLGGAGAVVAGSGVSAPAPGSFAALAGPGASPQEENKTRTGKVAEASNRATGGILRMYRILMAKNNVAFTMKEPSRGFQRKGGGLARRLAIVSPDLSLMGQPEVFACFLRGRVLS
jgi:hypothetical protein